MTHIAFTHARLFDGAHPPRDDLTVVVDGNQIVEVGPTASTSPSADQVIDATGHVLMPGMVVCHYHAQFGPWTGSGGALGIYTGSEHPPGVLMAAAINAAQAALFSGFTGIVGAGCSSELDVQL